MDVSKGIEAFANRKTNRAVEFAADAREKRQSFVYEQMEQLFVICHAHGDTDDEAISDCVRHWIDEKFYERLEGDIFRAATYCNELKMEIGRALSELRDVRQPILTVVEESRNKVLSDKDGGIQQTERCVHAYVDPTQFNDDNKSESCEGRDDEALIATLGNPHRCSGSSNLVATPVTASRASKPDSCTFSMLNFIVHLGSSKSITSYKQTQILQMLNKCEAMLQDLPPKVKVENDWVMESSRSGKSAKETVEAAIAAFIYSVDAKDCDCLTTNECLQRQLEDSVNGKGKHRMNPKQPEDTSLLGWNGSHWAMMNTVLRVHADTDFMNSLDTKSQQQLVSAVEFFEPLRELLDLGLKVFPREPRVVFRGITVPVAHKYSLGSTIQFAPFTSTSLEGEEALRFMRKGGTYFVISTHSGAMIADFSHYPEQAEALLRTNREFIVTSKMSGTLQQILGNDFDVIFMSETNSPLDDKAKIRQLVDGQHTTKFVYAGYQKIYVEGRVSQEPPSGCDPHVKPFPLYKATAHFVNGLSLPYMLLLGSGGSGKTSALIGCLCHLMSLPTKKDRPLLPIFVSLPAVGQALYNTGGLDKYIQDQLRLPSDAAFNLVLSETRVVLLLDSLDEVPMHEDSKASILSCKLLEQNPWTARAKVILSSRTEFLDREEYTHDTVLHNDPSKTLVYHVWPFNEEDRSNFMRQAASDRIEELARREATAQYKQLSDTFQLSDDELSHPCILRIATDVVANRSTNSDSTSGLQNIYTLYESFVSTTLTKRVNLAPDLIKRVTIVLQQIAVEMARMKRWQMPVVEVRQRLHEALGGDSSISVVELLKTIPSRCEDINNDSMLWSFWHKTVGEHLVAQAIAQKLVDASVVSADLQKEHPVIAEMVGHSQLNVYRFAKDAENISDTIQRIVSLPKVTKIDMSHVQVPGADVDVSSWIADHLKALDPGPNRQALELILPCFSEVTNLSSFELPASCDGKLSVNMQHSFPAVMSVCDLFSISNVVSVVLPEFPKLEVIPLGFLMCNHQLERVEWPKLAATRIDDDFMSRTFIKDVVLGEFDSVTSIGSNFLAYSSDATSGMLIGTSYTTIENDPSDSITTVTLPKFPLVVSIDNDFMATASSALEDLHFDPDAFPLLRHVGKHFLANTTTASAELSKLKHLALPHFPMMTSVGDGFLANQPKLLGIEFNDNYFKNVELRPAQFCEGTKLHSVPSRWFSSHSIDTDRISDLPKALEEA